MPHWLSSLLLHMILLYICLFFILMYFDVVFYGNKNKVELLDTCTVGLCNMFKKRQRSFFIYFDLTCM